MKLMKKNNYIHNSNAGAVFAHATTSRRRRMIPRNWDFLSPKYLPKLSVGPKVGPLMRRYFWTRYKRINEKLS